MPTGVARLSAFAAAPGCGYVAGAWTTSRCLFRWRGVTDPAVGSTTVIRASWRWPRTVNGGPPVVPGFCDSPFWNLATSPTSGPFTPWRFVSGFGVPGSAVAQVAGAIVLFCAFEASLQGPASLIVAVLFPEWKTAA